MKKIYALLLITTCCLLNVSAQSWTPQASGTTQNLLAITSSTDTVAYAFGTSGNIRRTSNAGFNWVSLSSTSSSFNGAVSLSDTTALACGNGGNTYRITTVSSSTLQISALSANALYAVDAFNANQLCVVGSGGAVATSSNGGVSWTVQTSGITTDFRGIDCVNATTAYAVGSGGVIRKTTDNGVTWATQTSGSAQTLVGVSFVSVSQGWVVGAAGTILTTSNGGTTWTPQTSGTTVVLRDVHFVSTTQGWIVGDNGTILYTNNGGTSWTTQVSGTTQQLNAISMATTTTGWIAGHAGTILVYCSIPAQPGAISGATTVCQNSTQNYTINPVSGAYNYQWSVPSGWNIAGGGNTTNVSIDQIQLPNGTISVRTNAKGCSSAATTLALTVNAAPQTTGPITGPVTTCSGTTQAYSIGALPGITSYTWTLPNGWSGTPSFTNMSAVVGNSGGTISVVANNSLCSSFPPSTLSVAVNASPTQPGPISGNTNVCAGSNQTYSITPVSGAVSYSWVLPGGWGGTSTSTSITTTATGNGGNVRVASVNGCGTSPYSTLAVTANIISTPTISISTANTTICQNATINFSSTTTNGGSAPDYQWKKNGNNITGATAAVHSTSLLSNGDVISCVFTSNAACATPTSVTSNSITVSVTPLIVPTVSISATQSTICSGNSVTFTATPNNATLAPSYQWKRNGNNIGGATNATYSTASLVNNDQISCELTTNANCVSPNSATSNIITIAVSGTVTPAISIAASSDSVCPSQSVTFTATPTNGGTSPTYQWKKNGNNISGATSATYTTSTLLSSDVFTCVLTSSVACASPTTATSNSVSVFVRPTIVPSVSISASSTTICAVTSVTFTATPTNGGSAPAYQWKKNGANITGATNAGYTTTALVNGDIITCVLTSNANCASPTTATSNSITMTVNPLVTPSLSISATQTTICSGNTVTFTATPTNGGASPSYQWKVNGNNVGTNSATYTSSTLSNGNLITCVLTSNANCASTTSATSNTITITVSSSVTPAVVVSASADSICPGQGVTFTAVPTNGGSTPGYQWKKNGNNISGANSATYTTSTLLSTDVFSCVLTSSVGCASPTTATSNNKSIFVKSTFAPTVAITPSVSSVCQGNNVDFTSTISGGGTAPSYQWKVNGSNVTGAVGNQFSSTSLLSGDVVTLQLTSSDACAVPTVVTSQPATLTINPVVTPSVSVSASQTVICTGANVIFTATVTNGGTAPTYQWRLNGNNISGATSATYTSTSLADGDAISCRIVSNEACVTSSTATSQAVTVTETSNVIASVSITASTTSVCSGESITLTSTPTNGGAAPVYQWKKNNQNITGATSASYTDASPANSDVYKCEMTSNASCVQQPTVLSNEETVTVNTLPDVTITQVANELSVPAAATYQWFDCGTSADISGATTATYTATANGSYAVRVSNSAGCTDTSECVNVTTVGVEEISANNIQVSPNPFQESIVLSFKYVEEKEGMAELYDLAGRLLHRETINESQQAIPVTFIAQGTYLLKVTFGDNIWMKQLVKQ